MPTRQLNLFDSPPPPQQAAPPPKQHLRLAAPTPYRPRPRQMTLGTWRPGQAAYMTDDTRIHCAVIIDAGPMRPEWDARTDYYVVRPTRPTCWVGGQGYHQNEPMMVAARKLRPIRPGDVNVPEEYREDDEHAVAAIE